MKSRFWCKFLRYSLIGFSALILLAGAQHNFFNLQKGAENVLADDGTIVAAEDSDDGTIVPAGDTEDDGTIVPTGNGGIGDDGTIVAVPDRPPTPSPVQVSPQQPAVIPQPPSAIPIVAAPLIAQAPSQLSVQPQQTQTTIIRETETAQNINQPAVTAVAQGGNAVSRNINENENNNTNINTNNNNNCTGGGSCSGGGAVVSVQTTQNPVPQVALAPVSAPATFRQAGVTPVVVSTPVPAVAQAVSAQQLPKTGLPSLVWAALAFIPAGLKMRSFSQVRKALENKASYIWEERQFKSIP